MLTGRNPVDGEPLVGMRGVPANGSVPGFDLTFSAPKSVSLLWGLGGADVAIEAKADHREAVQAALGYMHVLVPNATKADGRWTRLYHPAIYDHATTASYKADQIGFDREAIERTLGVRDPNERYPALTVHQLDRAVRRVSRTSTAATRSRPSPTRCETARVIESRPTRRIAAEPLARSQSALPSAPRKSRRGGGSWRLSASLALGNTRRLPLAASGRSYAA
jgi:TrwC relaxase